MRFIARSSTTTAVSKSNMSNSRLSDLQPIFDWVDFPATVTAIGVDVLQERWARADEQPSCTIDLAAFAISRTPVTNAQYAQFVAATGHRPPAHWEGTTPPESLVQHPVTYVDWYDATAFCAWAGVRLPSEAEWEYAARGGDDRLFPWGEPQPGPLTANFAGRFGTTTPVGMFPAGANPYGLLDLAGNVWEWTSSSYRPYPYDPDDGRESPTALGPRVLRGGSYNHRAADLRCAARGQLYADACDEYIGFRVVTAAPQQAIALPFDWVNVPAGRARLGSPDEARQAASGSAALALPELGSPRHQVRLVAFQLSRTPVTNAQYAQFVAATGHRPPAHWEAPTPPEAIAQHPVTYVDWFDAQAFCAWAGVRLPSEAEWEYAARGIEERAYPWGEHAPNASLAHYCASADALTTVPVGSCPAGATPEGLLDMAGNVWEWMASLHRSYPYDASDGREDMAAPGRRVLRGGSFRSDHAHYLHSAFRSLSYPARRRDHIGFRVAR
jgi:formylglycine-generating enzyme required for sulfatase activity